MASKQEENYSHAELAKSLKVAKSTVTNVIKVLGERLSTSMKPGSGGNRKPEAAATTKRVASGFKRNPNISVRDVANKLRMLSTTVHRARSRAGLSTYKKVVTSNRDDKQNKTSKTRYRKLYTTMLKKFDCVVMDDENLRQGRLQTASCARVLYHNQRGKLAHIFKHV